VSLVGGSCIFISLHIFFTFKKQFTNMKIYKIRHLWALALMLGLGGCKATDAIVATKCDYSKAEGGSCKACETPFCETITGIELLYGGKGVVGRHIFNMRYPNLGKDLALSVCDSTKLKDVTLKVGTSYIIDYNRKLGCQQVKTTSAFILEGHAGDIISIREKK
jgi:hypothetical protein